jgi:hypothetical protein
MKKAETKDFRRRISPTINLIVLIIFWNFQLKWMSYRLPNSTKEFSFEGMVYYLNFPVAAEVAAYWSQGCSKSVGSTSITWTAQSTCQFTCPDGTSAMQTCHFMISRFQCLTDAMSLLECLTDERFWQYASYTPSLSYKGVDLKCTECGD